MKYFLVKSILFLGLVLTGQILLSLEYGVKPFRVGIPDAQGYTPDSLILAFQQFFQPHPTLGFTWKENLGADRNIDLRWADQEEGAVVTDRQGFINSPYAIEARAEGKPIHIIGLGSSFMQGAAAILHDFFWAKGSFYYNMATPRHTLPQFNIVLRDYALVEKPEWIVYDLNEASFSLIGDYESWSESGLEWFTYHSGTWSGPPIETSFAARVLEKHPALNGLAQSMRRKVGFTPTIETLSDKEAVDKAYAYISSAHALAQKEGIKFFVLLIPSKDVAIYGKSEKSALLNATLPRLQNAGIPVLDLRIPFATENDPRALYYKIDGHWNSYGIYKAGMAMADFMAEK